MNGFFNFSSATKRCHLAGVQRNAALAPLSMWESIPVRQPCPIDRSSLASYVESLIDAWASRGYALIGTPVF
jgi:hypothetical protein